MPPGYTGQLTLAECQKGTDPGPTRKKLYSKSGWITAPLNNPRSGANLLPPPAHCGPDPRRNTMKTGPQNYPPWGRKSAAAISPLWPRSKEESHEKVRQPLGLSHKHLGCHGPATNDGLLNGRGPSRYGIRYTCRRSGELVQL